MAIYELCKDSIKELVEANFAKAGICERADLQRLLRDKIGLVAPGALVISEEFADWEDSKRRLDLLVPSPV